MRIVHGVQQHKLEEHYFSAHHVVLQPSCCAPPSVFQTIMGKELQLRQGNFASFSITKLLLRHQMDPDEARDILGATCSLTEDKTRIWHVKMPDFRQAAVEMPDIVSPDLHWLADEEADLNDYLQDLLIRWYVCQDQTIVCTGTSKRSALRADTENRVLLGISGSFLCIHSV